MPNPSFAEYTDALRLDLGIVLSDPLLGRGTLRMHGPGLPVAHSGNFALTFEVVVDGRKFAVRCFHKQSDSLHARYDAISRHLGRIESPYFVGFEFQPYGIITESGSHPIVRMEWAEGQSLAGFVADHLHDVNALQQLRVTLRRLAQHLRDNGIAHGDIQPTNLVVEGASSLKLIDYDGMFVPELASLCAAELGQRNFQHPGRRPVHFDARLDDFSFCVVDLALDALCKRPDLWDLTGSGDDAFLLRAADFADPAHSPVFSVLGRVPGLEQRTRYLAAICVSPFQAIPTFEDFLAGRNIPAVTVVFSGDATAALRRPYLSPYEIVDATNFARCCAHVGDCVELIGRIVRVTRSDASRSDGTGLRVEFGERSHDLVCLNIWPDALARLADLPDESWVGQWVSAVGLVEPVSSGQDEAQHQKDVSVSITEQSQLQRITESEAQHRLRGRGGTAKAALDMTGGVATDPVVTDVAPRPRVSPTRRVVEATRPAPQSVIRPQAQPPVPASSSSESAPVPSPAEIPAATSATIPAVVSEAVPPAVPEEAPPETAAEAEPALAPEPAPETLVASPLPRPPRSEPRPASSAPGNVTSRRRVAWIAASLAASVLAVAIITRWEPSETTPGGSTAHDEAPAADQTVASAAAPSDASSIADAPASLRAPAELRSQQNLAAARLPLETTAGRLSISQAGDGSRSRVVLLDGKIIPRLRDDRIVLAHRAVYSDREVIVGFTQCNGDQAPCGLRQPFWLELSAGSPPSVRQVAGLWAGSRNGAVSATNDGVRIALGVWNGERRVATLTTAGDIEVARTREARGRLARADCQTVAASLEACARSRDCRSFAGSAAPIPRSQRTRLTRIYHETTGFDATAFTTLCVRSCQLGLTPSTGFIRANVCSGARADQWPADNPAAGLFEGGR